MKPHKGKNVCNKRCLAFILHFIALEPRVRSNSRLKMHFLGVYFLVALIAPAFSQPDLLFDDVFLASSDSNIFLDDNSAATTAELYPPDPIFGDDGDGLTIPDSTNFLAADPPTDCLSSAFPTSPLSRIRARANICNNVDLNVSPHAGTVLTTAEEVENHWCSSTHVEGFGNVPVCHPETGSKVSSEHILNKLQGYDFSQAHFVTLFRCTLSKLYHLSSCSSGTLPDYVFPPQPPLLVSQTKKKMERRRSNHIVTSLTYTHTYI